MQDFATLRLFCKISIFQTEPSNNLGFSLEDFFRFFITKHVCLFYHILMFHYPDIIKQKLGFLFLKFKLMYAMFVR